MKSVTSHIVALTFAVGLIVSTACSQPPIPDQEQPEVLTRGPVHEAFAEPVITQIQDGLVVPNQPPDDIDEVPPDDRPQGDDYVWVPGYWSWDGDRENFIWVSGCWRAAPPNMSWVPGYWVEVDEGYEWVAGFWTQDDTQDIEYLPAPDMSYDDQPSNSRHNQNDFWVPSCQYWSGDRYILRSGYWLESNPDWVWTPSHYVWSPRGYIFCEGHWDYPLEQRGVLFAPVYFPHDVYRRTSYRYSPTIVLNLGMLTVSMFTYPRYSHFYFGDYYDDSYITIGIYPRYEVDQRRTWYDPTFVYDRWHHRDEPRWADNQRHEYEIRRVDRTLRPARTYVEMEKRRTDMRPDQQRANVQIAQPISVVVAAKQTRMKFVRSDAHAQKEISNQTTAARSYKSERNRWESNPTTPRPVMPGTQPRTTEPNNPGHKTPVTTETRNVPMTPRADPGTRQIDRSDQTGQPRQIKNQNAPPRDVRVAKPERVKIPPPPIVAKQPATDKTPPSRPMNERKIKSETKETPKVSPNSKGHTPAVPDKSKDKEKGNDKGHDRSK
jgi:hypothetical protein